MDVQQVSEHLNLLGNLNRKQVFDLLFNLGHIYKDFKELLAITHSTTFRKRLSKCKELGLAALGTPKIGSYKFRVARLLSKQKTVLDSHEYHILYTLVESPYITASLRDNLKESLGYALESHEVVEVHQCAVCSHIGSSNLCLSCRRNILSFTKYRRESFIIPINYTNFNIRGHINTEGELHFVYKDWDVFKHKSTIQCKLLSGLPEGSEPIQYELPFVELQRRLS